MDKFQIPNLKSQINSKFQFPKFHPPKADWSLVIVYWLLFGYWCLVIGVCPLFAQENKIEPIIVNGDIVEYVTEKNEFIASGNVSVDYKGTKLTCQKLTLNTQTKDAFAEGDARIDDQRGVIEGSKLIYNFQTKTGTIIDSEFRANPYFGVAEKTEKVSEAEFIATRGYYTTCSLDNPHYRIKSRKMKVFPGDKIQTR
ncbi:MAG: LPS-assembly protein LptD, partial [Candidatus Omnitrophica bacterium]|nr:LPS-assembly protein LptD [Candidatus Omnitrophota bacterium]